MRRDVFKFWKGRNMVGCVEYVFSEDEFCLWGDVVLNGHKGNVEKEKKMG